MVTATLDNVLPQWLNKNRVKILLIVSAIALLSLSIFLWIQIEDWTFRQNTLLYNIPIALYCMLWCNILSQYRQSTPLVCFFLDLSIFVLSIVRGYSSFGILLYSGHTLFLVYTGVGWWFNRPIRYTALIICLQVIYWKWIIWDDHQSFFIGILFALPIVLLRKKFQKNSKIP